MSGTDISKLVAYQNSKVNIEMLMASILQIVVLQIIVRTSLCNEQPCTGMSCPDGLSLVPIKNLNDPERWTSDSNETVQVVCYNEMGEPQGCLPNYDDTKLFQIVLKVACSLSIVGDGFVIISLCLFRTIRTSFHVLIINVCLANCGFDLTVVILGSTEYTKELCYSVAVLLHFFLLSQFMLMSATMLDTVCSFYNASKLKKQSLNCRYRWIPILLDLVFGWGVPLSIVTTALIVDNTSDWVGYGRNPYTCWIDHLVSEVIFIDIPFSISILFNVIMFTILIALVIKSPGFHCGRKHSNKQTNVQYTRFVITIFCASGITWICAIFKYVFTNVWFARTVVLLNSFQGLAICLAFLFRQEVFQRYRNLISHCRACSRADC